jgi:hypothetical protein
MVTASFEWRGVLLVSSIMRIIYSQANHISSVSYASPINSIMIWCINSYGLHGQGVSPYIARVVRVSHASHNHVYSFSVPHIQAYHKFKCIFIQCITYPSVSHLQVPIHSVSHIQASHIQASHIQASHTFNRITPQVPIHSVSHTLKCLTPSSVSHPQVSHISKCLFIQCLTHSSASHLRVPIHLVSHISTCVFVRCITVFCINHTFYVVGCITIYCPCGQYVSASIAHVVIIDLEFFSDIS